MKTRLTSFTLLFVFNFLIVKSQNNSNPFSQIKDRPSINISGRNIRCYELKFKGKIKKCTFSTDSSYVYLYLSNADSIYCFDYKKNKIIWKENWILPAILENIGSNILISDNKIIDNGHIKFLNAYSGKLIDASADNLSYFNSSKKILFNRGPWMDPSIINLYSGKTIWSYPKDSSYFSGIHDILIEDNSITLLSDNVYKINNDIGLTWTYPLRCSEFIRHSEFLKHCRFGGYATHFTLLGLLPRNSMTPYIYNSRNRKCGMESNILKVDSSIFVADMEKIVKLDFLKGKEIWKTKLPFELTGRSELFNFGTNIIMVNTGSSEVNEEFSDCGVPYVAVFDSRKGELIYKAELVKKPNRILYIKASNDFILLVFDDKIIELNKKDFSTKDYVLSDGQVKQFGHFQSFIDRDNFPDRDLGRFLIIYPQEIVNHDLILYDITSIKKELINAEFIIPTQKGILSFNKQFENSTYHSLNQLGIKKYENDLFNIVLPFYKDNVNWNSLFVAPYFLLVDKVTSTEIAKIDFESGVYSVINTNFIEVLNEGILVYNLDCN